MEPPGGAAARHELPSPLLAHHGAGPQVLVGYLDADGAYNLAKGTLSSSGSLSFAAAYTVVASGSVGDSVSLTAWVHHACCQAAEILARPTNGNPNPNPNPNPKPRSADQR